MTDWKFDVENAPLREALVIQYIDGYGNSPLPIVTVGIKDDKGSWFDVLAEDFLFEEVCAYKRLPDEIPVKELEKEKTNYEKIQSMSEEELSTKALDSQIDNDPVLKRLEERIKNSLSVLTMVNSDYSPEAFTGRMESIRIGNTFYGADAKRVDPLHFHEEADELMLEFLRHLGYGEGCRIFEENPKWYS